MVHVDDIAWYVLRYSTKYRRIPLYIIFGGTQCYCKHVFYTAVAQIYHLANIMSSSLGSRSVPWLGEGLSMPSPSYPVLCFPLPDRVAPVFVQVVSPPLGSPPLGWSPLSSFLVIWSPSGDTRGPSVIFEAVDMPCSGPLHFSHNADYIYDFCPP